MFNSLRTVLLVWFGLVIGLLAAGLGAAHYRQAHRMTYERIDADLLAAAEGVAARMEQGEPEPALPVSYRERFGKRPEEAPYLRIWNPQGKLIVGETSGEPQPRPDLPPAPAGKKRPKAFHPREYQGRHELILLAPTGDRVVVGRAIQKELHELQRILMETAISSGVAAAIGLLGAWFISWRITAPIARMSQAAGEISAVRLDPRLDPGRTYREIRGLATTVNGALDRVQTEFERRNRFVADAAHELRTPVAVLQAQCEWALGKERTAAEYSAVLAACGRAAQRLSGLVNGLLLLARADSDDLSRRREPCPLDEIATRAWEFVQSLASEQAIRWECQLAPLTTQGDPELLATLVINLLSNAVRHNVAGGEANLSLVKEGSNALLRIVNSSETIPADHLPLVFERFHRVAEDRSNRGGTGLGLAICREIVRAHQGQITLVSAEGRTTVEVRLPLSEGAEPV